MITTRAPDGANKCILWRRWARIRPSRATTSIVLEAESLKKYCNQLSGWHAIVSASEQARGATAFFHLPGPAENVLDSKAGKKRISLEFIAMEPQPQPN